MLHYIADEKLSPSGQSDLIAKFLNNSLQLVETGSLSCGKLDKPCDMNMQVLPEPFYLPYLWLKIHFVWSFIAPRICLNKFSLQWSLFY